MYDEKHVQYNTVSENLMRVSELAVQYRRCNC